MGTSRLLLALDYAAKGYYVHPLCWPTDDGRCACDRGHTDKEVGKAPIAAHGSDDATRDPALIRDWWQRWPDANIGFNLEKSGIVDVAPDCAEWVEQFKANGMPRTACYTSRSAWHALYRLPKSAPRRRSCKSGQYDLMSKGNTAAPGSTHKSGQVYTLLSDLLPVEALPEAPAWVVEMLRATTQHRRSETTIDDPEIKRWLANIQTLLAADGLPRRLSEHSQTRQILAAGLVWNDTSAQRYTVARGLRMHGYANPKIAAMLIHFADYDVSTRKGTNWFYDDILRIIDKVAAELPDIEPTDGYEDRVPLVAPAQPLPQVARRKRGRPRTMTADDYLAWVLGNLDGDGVKMGSQRENAAALKVGIATIRRWEKALRGRLERRTFSHRHDSYLAVLGAIKNTETAQTQPESVADVVLSKTSADRAPMPEIAIDAVLEETPCPDTAPPAPRTCSEPDTPPLLDLVREAFDVLAADQVRLSFSRVRRYVLANAGGRSFDLDVLKLKYATERDRQQWARQDAKEAKRAREMGRAALAKKAQALGSQAAELRRRNSPQAPIWTRRAGIYAAEEARRDAREAQRIAEQGYVLAEQRAMLDQLDQEQEQRACQNLRKPMPFRTGRAARPLGTDRGASVPPLPASASVEPWRSSADLGLLARLKEAQALGGAP
jgi:Bifunctional DNA primase/polymerase, N-terminal